MKIQKIFTMLLFILLILTPVILANDATEEISWTDFSNAEIKLMEYDLYQFLAYSVTFENVQFNTEDETKYYIFISNSLDKPEFGATREELEKNATLFLEKESEKIISYKYMNAVLEKKGDVYLWIVESRANKKGEFENKEVLTAYKIEKPALKDLTNRITLRFEYPNDYLYLKEPYDIKTSRSINVKIGKITDNNILFSIKNQESGCFEKLLEYAKTAPSIYNEKQSTGQINAICKKIDLVENEYYYVYMKKDSEDGKYQEIEDVYLYQAKYVKREQAAYTVAYEGYLLREYYHKDFVWNIETNSEENSNVSNTSNISNTTDDTIANNIIPNAGESKIIGVFIVLSFALGLISFIKMKIEYK